MRNMNAALSIAVVPILRSLFGLCKLALASMFDGQTHSLKLPCAFLYCNCIMFRGTHETSKYRSCSKSCGRADTFISMADDALSLDIGQRTSLPLQAAADTTRALQALDFRI